MDDPPNDTIPCAYADMANAMMLIDVMIIVCCMIEWMTHPMMLRSLHDLMYMLSLYVIVVCYNHV